MREHTEQPEDHQPPTGGEAMDAMKKWYPLKPFSPLKKNGWGRQRVPAGLNLLMDTKLLSQNPSDCV
jgi:hypothetical protein